MKGLRNVLSFQNPMLNALAGFLACSSVAVAFALAFRECPYRTIIPIAFIGVVSAAAMQWGHNGAIVGVLSSAAIFACLLFEPLGRLAVSSQAARNNLSWMALFGIVAAFLLAPRRSVFSGDEQLAHPESVDRQKTPSEPR